MGGDDNTLCKSQISISATFLTVLYSQVFLRMGHILRETPLATFVICKHYRLKLWKPRRLPYIFITIQISQHIQYRLGETFLESCTYAQSAIDFNVIITHKTHLGFADFPSFHLFSVTVPSLASPRPHLLVSSQCKSSQTLDLHTLFLFSLWTSLRQPHSIYDFYSPQFATLHLSQMCIHYFPDPVFTYPSLHRTFPLDIPT